MSAEYLFYYSLFIIPSGLSTALQGYCRNDGSPVLVSIANVAGAAINIVLDYLFIFSLKGGLAGAAIATGIAQTAVLLILTTHFIFKKGQLRLSKFKPSGKQYRKVALRGLPECISQCETAITTLWLNQVLTARLGDIAANAYGIISYVAYFSMGISFGVSEGLQPLFGNAYGAKNENDLNFYLRAGIIVNFVGALIVNGLLLVIGRQVCGLFGASGETLDYTVNVMPLYAWGFLLTAFNTILSAYLFSTKRTTHAIILNTLRSFIVNTFVILVFPIVFGNDVIWHTFGISEAIIAMVAVLLVVLSERHGIVFKQSSVDNKTQPNPIGTKSI